ncbi:MAG: YfcE family phosphodiesterase [Magnetococcus sp. MYC-9]
MKMGIVSDSHDHMDNLHRVAMAFRQRGVAMVLHAGDCVSPPSVHCLAEWKLYGVCGNNDGERVGLTRAFAETGGQLAHEVLEMDVPTGKLAVYHGDVVAILNALIRCQTYSLVVTGHTHRFMDRWEGKTRILNPGTAHGFRADASVMVYDTQTAQVERITLP